MILNFVWKFCKTLVWCFYYLDYDSAYLLLLFIWVSSLVIIINLFKLLLKNLKGIHR